MFLDIKYWIDLFGKLIKVSNTIQVVPAQSRTLSKSYPFFFTPKSYPVFAGVNHLVPADCQVVPMSVLTICSANWYPCQLVPPSFHFIDLTNKCCLFEALQNIKHLEIISYLVCSINILLPSVSVVYSEIKDTTTNNLGFYNFLHVFVVYTKIDIYLIKHVSIIYCCIIYFLI